MFCQGTIAQVDLEYRIMESGSKRLWKDVCKSRMRWLEQRRYEDKAGIKKETTARKNEED